MTILWRRLASQQHGSNLIVALVSKQTLGALVGSNPELFFPQSPALTKILELAQGRASHDHDTTQGQAVDCGQVRVWATGGNRGVASLARNFAGPLVIASPRAGEVIHRGSENLFEFVLGAGDFTLKACRVQIVQVGMGHGMATNLESKAVQFPELGVGEISALSKKTNGDIESGLESCVLEQGRRHDKVTLGAIVESDCNRMLAWRFHCLADIHPRPAGIAQPVYLEPKMRFGNNVAHVAGLRLAQSAAGQFQFVIHEVDHAGIRRQKIFLNGAFTKSGTRMPNRARVIEYFLLETWREPGAEQSRASRPTPGVGPATEINRETYPEPA